MNEEARASSKKAKLVAANLVPHSPIKKEVLITRFGYHSGTACRRMDDSAPEEEKADRDQYNRLRKFVDSTKVVLDSFEKEFRAILANNSYYKHLEQYLDVDKNFQVTIGVGPSGENKFFTNRISGEKDIELNSMTALYSLKWNKEHKVKIIPFDKENFDILVGPVSLNLSKGNFLYLRPEDVEGSNIHSDYVLREFQHIDEDGRIKVSIPETGQEQEEENIQDTFDIQDIGMIPILALSGDKVCTTLGKHGAPAGALPQNMRHLAH